VKTLVGFAKVHLGGGETATATIEVQRQALARWDLASHGWIIDSGPHELLVAASATDIRSTVTITV